MADNSTQNKEVLVLSDESGNYYAIPRNVVEQHRVTGEQRAQIEKALGDDVSGYQMLAPQPNEMLAPQPNEMLAPQPNEMLAPQPNEMLKGSFVSLSLLG